MKAPFLKRSLAAKRRRMAEGADGVCLANMGDLIGTISSSTPPDDAEQLKRRRTSVNQPVLPRRRRYANAQGLEEIPRNPSNSPRVRRTLRLVEAATTSGTRAGGEGRDEERVHTASSDRRRDDSSFLQQRPQLRRQRPSPSAQRDAPPVRLQPVRDGSTVRVQGGRKRTPENAASGSSSKPQPERTRAARENKDRAESAHPRMTEKKEKSQDRPTIDGIPPANQVMAHFPPGHDGQVIWLMGAITPVAPGPTPPKMTPIRLKYPPKTPHCNRTHRLMWIDGLSTMQDLRAAIVKRLEDHFGYTYRPEQIILAHHTAPDKHLDDTFNAYECAINQNDPQDDDEEVWLLLVSPKGGRPERPDVWE